MKTAGIALSLAAIASLTNCSKNDTTPQPTSLQLTLTDEAGNRVSGATVNLYGSQTDWDNGTNTLGTQFSDVNGIVTFSGLQSQKYYWFAQKDCKNNIMGASQTAYPLTSNTKNTSITVLASTGTLAFNNTSSNPYHVYVNGQFQMDLNGGASYKLMLMPLGNYSMRVVQVSGYAFTPTDETFTGNLSSCGGTLTTTFP